ncbi:hypothetical protein D3C76_841140 [compost metagenome]
MLGAHQGIGPAALQQPRLLGRTEEVGHRDDHDAGPGAGQIDQRPGQAVVELQGQAANAGLLQAVGQVLDLLPQGLVIQLALAALQRRLSRRQAGVAGDGVEQAHWAHLLSWPAWLKSMGMGPSRLSSRLLWASTSRPWLMSPAITLGWQR